MDTLLKHRIVEILSVGWRQRHLAEVTEKSQVAVSKWTAGEILTISEADVQAIAELTGFAAQWIAHGTGDKYGPDGLKPAPGKVRSSKNYKRVEESQALARLAVLPGWSWDSLIQQVGLKDPTLAAMLHAFQLCNRETRPSLASMAKLIALARPPQAQKILRAMWRASRDDEHEFQAMTQFSVAPQEILVLRVFHASSPAARLALLDAILEFNHGYQIEQLRNIQHEAGDLSSLQLRILSALRGLTPAARIAVFDLAEVEAKELNLDIVRMVG